MRPLKMGRVREGVMINVYIATRFAWTLASVFGLSGLLHLAGLGPVKRAYARWDFAPGFERVAGVLQLIAAVFLAMPITRIWGVILSALVTFAIVVLLLGKRQYIYAVPGILVLAALVPTALADPI
jgi:hypothetical protein